MEEHGYSLTELEEMIPWEREVYVSLVADKVQKENERKRREKARMDALNSRTRSIR